MWLIGPSYVWSEGGNMPKATARPLTIHKTVSEMMFGVFEMPSGGSREALGSPKEGSEGPREAP